MGELSKERAKRIDVLSLRQSFLIGQLEVLPYLSWIVRYWESLCQAGEGEETGRMYWYGLVYRLARQYIGHAFLILPSVELTSSEIVVARC